MTKGDPMRPTLFAALLLTAAPAFAMPFPVPDGGASLSPEETQRLRGELQGIAQALGAPPVAAPTPPEKQRTTADVADRALDMLGNMVGSVAASVQKIAPEVWRVMVRQQYAKAVADLIPPLGVLLLAIVWHFVLRSAWCEKKWKDIREPEEVMGYALSRFIIPLALGGIGAGLLIGTAADSIKYLINPEFYAVRDLLTLILNPGAPQ